MTDTIFALASGMGKSAISVVRVSGPQSAIILETLTKKTVPQARLASLRYLYHPSDQQIIDQALILWFPGPKSFTGEDSVEFHLHGGPAVLNLFFDALQTFGQTRMAEAGEFTKRAFYNQKLDLTKVEGLADLVAAETVAQHRQAFQQYQGQLSNLYQKWRHILLYALAQFEALIDFPDEDLPQDLKEKIFISLQELKHQIASHLQDKRGIHIRDGIKIVLFGPPNAGKSTFLNYLTQKETAITSPIAGTTRDSIEIKMDLDGIPILLCDTAGIHKTKHPIENEAIKRSLDRAYEADLKIILIDVDNLSNLDQRLVDLIDPQTLIVFNKIDLLKNRHIDYQKIFPTLSTKPVFISLKENLGLDSFHNQFSQMINYYLGKNSYEIPAFTRQRHQNALQECHDSIHRALTTETEEMIAEDLRLALRTLGKITGAVNIEDLLDVVFKEFCIGK
ncbi:MAG: tRNA uridine-5-carboxymethylaminomethyl(34) synthesis GTPase MnmE [Alphaproteobacteria bacterium]|nr:tRNA uridine-5-carboxymethylaminomethyl(34) synthesis GTPase MnmE [Alphaproteobacteria bacterium]